MPAFQRSRGAPRLYRRWVITSLTQWRVTIPDCVSLRRIAAALRGRWHASMPSAAAVTILAASAVVPAMPYLLSFAAGAMMYVVVEELIPEMSEGKHSNWGTIAFSLGFVLMMILDVTLG